MVENSADAKDRAEIRRLACDPTKVELSTTAKYDLMGHDLTKEDVCGEIVEWIDQGERVKAVTLRGKHAGQVAYELKPRISDVLFYLKVLLCKPGQPAEYMLLISAHPDH